jgi:integrase
MYLEKAKPKNSKGCVSIISSNGRLQLRFHYGGKRHYISLGLPDNKVNRKAAEAKAKIIEADITFDRLDPTLGKYKPQTALSTVDAITPITPIEVENLNLVDLWAKYTQYKTTQVSESTLARDYGKVAKRLDAIPTNIEDAIAVRDWLLRNYSSEVARRSLVQINACYKWAVKSGLASENPFEGMANDIKKVKRDTGRTPFSAAERDAIIRTFENNIYSSPTAPVPHSYYTNYVKFLFMTGCRPEEAIALKWKHIATDCTKIQFKEALPSDTGILGKTKTGKQRIFPCNVKLKDFLQEIKPDSSSSESFVFQGPRGGVLDSHNFLNRVWKPVVENLVKAGKVEQYLPQYNIRHTFITLALENGLDAKDVARLVGNSPEVVYRHYAGSKRELFVPEF